MWRYFMKKGIYDQIINEKIAQEMVEETELFPNSISLDEYVSPQYILSLYVYKALEKALYFLNDKNLTVEEQAKFCNEIMNLIAEKTNDDSFKGLLIDLSNEQKARVLQALIQRQNNPSFSSQNVFYTHPETSINESSLFTGSSGEPNLFSEFKKEIESADRVDFIVSFIKFSGLRLIIDDLKKYTENGGHLRIITTTYIGATDYKSIDALSKLSNTEIKISYDVNSTRLHAKSYIFHRDNGFTTAYVGSSNISGAALSNGLEWNVKLTNQDQTDNIRKIEATFESYWENETFETYKQEDKERFKTALNQAKNFGLTGSISETITYTPIFYPLPYQNEVLDKLKAEREIRNIYKNLIVAATGTGKTMISAFDYQRFSQANPKSKNRLLYVAHREEILKQSIGTFRSVLQDPNFGDLCYAGNIPSDIDYLFCSIQTFNSQKLWENIDPDFYDYIIVDESHHVTANSYQQLMNHFKPKILLGMTATPERMDGESILPYFDNRISYEIRLPKAIDEGMLCPFQYFGVSDTVDLSTLRWGVHGYDPEGLAKAYIDNRERTQMIIKSLSDYVADIDQIIGLGFCVSVDHAKYMASEFTSHGIPSKWLSGESTEEERNEAKKDLVGPNRKYIFLFVVDIYNEGVDIPQVNTVLFLRPTESLTVFIQQLGRGLRKFNGKDCLTVLDYVGQANKKYRFDTKFKSMLEDSSINLKREIENGFSHLPHGCYVRLEKMAKDHILSNIKTYFASKSDLLDKAFDFKNDSNENFNLSNFCKNYGIEPLDIYKRSLTFTDLRAYVGLSNRISESEREEFDGGLVKLSLVDSASFIQFLQKILPELKNGKVPPLKNCEKRMLKMFYYTFYKNIPSKNGFSGLEEAIFHIVKSPFYGEIIELLSYRFDKIDVVEKPLSDNKDIPIMLHSSYTRDQLLAGFNIIDSKQYFSLMSGVFYDRKNKTDIFFVTLNKSDKDYSPSNLYKDYALNNTLFHWQSQSTTSDTSETAKRYINHKQNGSKILIVVRENKNIDDTNEVSPYFVLGYCDYVSHTGSQPIDFNWKMHEPIPAKFFMKANKLEGN